MAQSKPHLLVIRLSAMGDCAMAVPVLLALKKQYPELALTVLTKPFFKTIFEFIPDIEVIGADTKGEHKGFLGILKLGQTLAKRNFTGVADLHHVLRSQLLRQVFAVHRIPTAHIDKGRKAKKALTRQKNKIFKPLKTTPERYATVFKDLGYPIDLQNLSFLKSIPLRGKAQQIIGDKTTQIIGIAPFAAHTPKAYPLDLMQEVIAHFNAQSNIKILLFGGGQKEVEQLDKLAGTYDNVISVAGKLRFKEEIALLSHLDIMLSMDSGNGHLAAMFGIPVITLWGGTHPYAGFAPFGQPAVHQILPDLKQYPLLPTSVFGNKTLPGYEDVMRSITPGKVIQSVESALMMKD